MRLIDRNDTSLAIALVASALVIFQQPLRVLVDAAHVVELRYNIDLLPGLTVLVGTFGFHQYRKRQQARAAEAAASAEAAQARARSAELEQLVALGRALGSALDPAATRQVFWRYMPGFAHDRELWMLTRKNDGWDTPVRDAMASAPRPVEVIEALANEALGAPVTAPSDGDGILLGDDLCLPMVVGENAVGVIGVRNHPTLSASERHALAAASALLGIAIRNGQLLAQTRESSIRDSLTGCFNRAYALEALHTELHRARRTGRPLSLMMFDIDEFKSVNDKFGHLAGDAILGAIGGRMASMFRATDIKCRYGGDEFLVILPDTPFPGAERAAATLTSEVAHLTVTVPGGLLSPTISLGVTTAFEDEHDANAVIARADEALYRAKRGGRNRYAASPLAPAV